MIVRTIVLIVHNVRSSHNVGSLLRTADGLGISSVFLTGYTPYPLEKHDTRLPHIAQKIHRRIQKTALGAEQNVHWTYEPDVFTTLEALKRSGYLLCALEQTPRSQSIITWQPPAKVAVIVGRETEGIEHDVLAACDSCIEIPMLGKKESLNVVQAAAMALYHARFMLR